MSGERFTPGPWEIVGDDGHSTGIPFIDISAGEMGTASYTKVCEACSDLVDDDDGEGDFVLTDESRANARLIAAAPDLYAALRELLEMGELFIPAQLDSPGFIRARAALAKAANGDAQ